ncbi:hypothetical protein HDU83_000284 [Entophlyctis luteolus]|nr:hypothetical protein HDU83_000284 [Entophlyctis luteolus]
MKPSSAVAVFLSNILTLCSMWQPVIYATKVSAAAMGQPRDESVTTVILAQNSNGSAPLAPISLTFPQTLIALREGILSVRILSNATEVKGDNSSSSTETQSMFNASTRPSLVALLQHTSGHEKLFLLPSQVLDDETVQVYAPGTYNLTVWAEGLHMHWTPDTWRAWPSEAWGQRNRSKVPQYAYGPFRYQQRLEAVVADWQLTVQARNDGDPDWFGPDYFARGLPKCRASLALDDDGNENAGNADARRQQRLDDLQTRGRWMSPQLLQSHALMPTTVGRGAPGPGTPGLVFFPDTCELAYMGQRRSRQCLRGRTVALVGDSTLGEIMLDLVGHVFGQKPASDDLKEVRKMFGLSREFSAGGVLAEFHSHSRISLIWAPQLSIDDAAVGGAPVFCFFRTVTVVPPGSAIALPLFGESHYVDRLMFKLRHPTAINSLPHASRPEEPTYRQAASQIHENRGSDFIFFTSGLHDLHDFGPAGSDYTIDDYPIWFEKAITALQQGQSNFYVRQLNQQARKICNQKKIPILDANGLQKHRITSSGHPQYGDHHHANDQNFHRSPFGHAVVQMMLNFMCDEDE